MKFYNCNGEWLPDRRKKIKFSYNDSIENSDEERRRIDIKMLKHKELTVANAFTLLGVSFKYCIRGESIIINHYNTEKNLKDIQAYTNEIQKSLYSIVFEDDSFVVYETNKIKLFYNEHDAIFMQKFIDKYLFENDYYIDTKIILIKPDE